MFTIYTQSGKKYTCETNDHAGYLASLLVNAGNNVVVIQNADTQYARLRLVSENGVITNHHMLLKDSTQFLPNWM